MKKAFAVVLLLLASGAAWPVAPADPGFIQHLGAALPLQTALTNEAGRAASLGEYFAGRPVVLVLGAYGCREPCAVPREGMARALDRTGFKAGRDFEVVLLSIDPREGPSLASARKAAHIARLGLAPVGWHFLTGGSAAIDAVAHAVGFRYVLDQSTGQYAHPEGLVVASPDGRISRYFFGPRQLPGELRLGLIEASGHRIGAAIDRLTLLCFTYDPQSGRYLLAVTNLFRVLVLGIVFGIALAFWRRARQGRPAR